MTRFSVVSRARLVVSPEISFTQFQDLGWESVKGCHDWIPLPIFERWEMICIVKTIALIRGQQRLDHGLTERSDPQ